MLLSFRIKNSRSILDVTIPMSYAEKKAPNGYNRMELAPFLKEGNIRAIPCLAIYGPNASGKSNIIKAFQSFTNIVKNKDIQKTYAPNKLHPENETTSYGLEFLAEGNIFVYTLETNSNEILHESLNYNSLPLFSIEKKQIQFEKLATEAYSVAKLKEIYSVECLNENRDFQTPFLTVIGKNYAGLNFLLTTAYSYITNKLEVYSNNEFSFTHSLNKLTGINDKKETHRSFKDIVSILQKLDIDISRMEYKKDVITESLETGKIPSNNYELYFANNEITATEISSYHKDILGNEVQFNFKDESRGTQRIASVLGVVLSVLRTGSVLIIDELGNSLHPYLFAEIVRMFKDKRYNTTNAQLIFTTHYTDIMDQDMMRISEVGIVNKTLRKGTTFKRLSDFKGIRNVTKFRKQYLEGVFTGIPFPYI